jgi:hypothetical protein
MVEVKPATCVASRPRQLNSGRLRFARAHMYMDRDYWTKQLREAEQELAAAKRRTELNAAAGGCREPRPS